MALMSRAVMLVGLLAVGLISSLLAPERARSLAFFATSAQIVPVLLLVLVLEARLVRFSGTAPTWDEVRSLGRQTAARLTILNAAAVGLTLFALLWAEYAALGAMADGQAVDGNVRAVFRGLGVGFGAIVFLAFGGNRTPSEPPAAAS